MPVYIHTSCPIYIYTSHLTILGMTLYPLCIQCLLFRDSHKYVSDALIVTMLCCINVKWLHGKHAWQHIHCIYIIIILLLCVCMGFFKHTLSRLTDVQKTGLFL